MSGHALGTTKEAEVKRDVRMTDPVEPSSDAARPQLLAEYSALSQLSQGVIVRNPDLTVAYLNEAARQILRIDENDEVGPDELRRSWRFSDEHGTEVEMPISHVIDDGVSWHNVLFQVQRPGEPVMWLMSDARPYRFADGRIGSLSVFTDVTAQVTARIQAEENERYFRLLTANATDVMWHNDATGRVAWVSDSVTAVLGYAPADFLGHGMADLTHPDDLAEAATRRSQSLAGQNTSGEVRIRCADGSWRTMGIRGGPFRGADGRINGSFVVARDLTDDVAARADLARSERQFRTLTGLSDLLRRGQGTAQVLDQSCEFLSEALELPCVMVFRSDDATVRVARQPGPGTSGDWGHVADMMATDGVDAGATSTRILAAATVPGATDALAGLGVAHIIVAPMVARGRQIGSVCVFPAGSEPPQTETVRLVTEIANRVAVALDEAELHEQVTSAERRYRLLAEGASDVVLQISPQGTYEWASPSVTEMLGWLPEDFIGRTGGDFIHPDDFPRIQRLAEALTPGTTESARYRYRRSDGRYIWVSAVSRHILGEDGHIEGRIVGLRGIDQEVHAEEALARSEERFRLAMASAPIGMALVALDGSFLTVNQSLADMLDRPVTELTRLSFQDITHPDDLDEDLHNVQDLLAGRIPSYRMEKRYLRQDGSPVWIELQVSLVRDETGAPQHFISQMVDIDDRRRANEQLEFRARHDPLTGAVNRAELQVLMAAMLKSPATTGQTFAILFLDLDGFKRVNDTLGHSAGDEVVQLAAERLMTAVRGSDVVARLGGDEFVVLLTGLAGAADAMATAEKIRRLMDRPMTLETGVARVTTSIGVALAVPGDTTVSLLAKADSALYRAKDQGRNRCELYVPGDEYGQTSGSRSITR